MQRIKRTLYQRLGFIVVAVLGSAAHAGPTAYVVEDDTDRLYRFDLDTLQTTLVGQIGVEFVGDIAALSDGTIAGQHDADPGYFLIDGQDASLLGQGSNTGPFIGDLDAFGDRLFAYSSGALREIDPLTGQRTALSTLAIPTHVNSLAMTSASEAFFYSIGDVGLRELYRVDFTSGSVDLIRSATDLSFGLRSLDYFDGVLYAMDRFGTLSIVDQTDGSFTEIGQIGISNVGGFTLVPAPASAALLACAGIAACRRRR